MFRSHFSGHFQIAVQIARRFMVELSHTVSVGFPIVFDSMTTNSLKMLAVTSHSLVAFFRRHVGSALLGVACCLAASSAVAADDADYHPLEGANTASPQDTLNSFLNACHDAYSQVMETGVRANERDTIRHATYRISRCLDLSHVPPTIQRQVMREAAACLKEVLDRIDIPDDIPDAEQVEREEIDRYTIGGKSVEQDEHGQPQ